MSFVVVLYVAFSDVDTTQNIFMICKTGSTGKHTQKAYTTQYLSST